MSQILDALLEKFTLLGLQHQSGGASVTEIMSQRCQMLLFILRVDQSVIEVRQSDLRRNVV